MYDETSQRIVDVLLKAFGAIAASQGICNNFTLESMILTTMFLLGIMKLFVGVLVQVQAGMVKMLSSVIRPTPE